jgi:hypothetical protein
VKIIWPKAYLSKNNNSLTFMIKDEGDDIFYVVK